MHSSRTIEILKYPNNSTSCNVSRKSEFNGVSLSGALNEKLDFNNASASELLDVVGCIL